MKNEFNESEFVTIGEQVWSSKNLNTAKFRNGDPIPEAKTDEEWIKAGKEGKPAWSYYDNYPANGAKYGRLYNWYAVNDPRGLAPNGWQIPTDSDWTQLTDFLGGKEVAGNKIKSTSGWEDSGNGTNESMFNGLPGGGCFANESFDDVGYSSAWWSTTEGSSTDAWGRSVNCDNGNVYPCYCSKTFGLSVRCIKDSDDINTETGYSQAKSYDDLPF